MSIDFEIIEHTADVGIRAYGTNLKQAFANAARALFSLIADLDTVTETSYRDIVLTAPDRESLLVAWLNELIYLFDVDNIIFKRFDIHSITAHRLQATAYGETADSSRHKLKMGVKAATHHMLKVDKGDGYRVEVLLDI